MDKPKFTSGRWTIEQDDVGPIWIKSEDGEPIAGVHGTDIISDEQMQANARLISLAPTMYEVLETIENDNLQVPAWLWNRIRSVLEKVNLV